MAEARASVAGDGMDPTDQVFTTRTGEPLDAANVRRDFKAIVKKAGLKPEWTPRELRHSFVSLLSDRGTPLERSAQLVGHSGRATTEAVCRKQLRPVIAEGAEAMDEIFARRREATVLEAWSVPFGPLFGSPSTTEAHSRSREWASDLCRGGGI